MRRLLAIVGLLGIFLTPIPEAAFGGRAQAGQVGSTIAPVPGLVSTVLVFKRADE
jgi:hypothetical protein